MTPRKTKPTSPADPPAEGVTNVLLALGALSRLGGNEAYVDIEVVTVALYKTAPDRFGWRTKKLPSWERTRLAFVHANQAEDRRGRVPLVVSNRDGTSWRLTAEGVAFVGQNSHKLEELLKGQAPPKRTGRAAERIRQIRKHPAFNSYVNGTPVSRLPPHQLADLLLCPPDAGPKTALRKADQFRAAAIEARDSEVASFLASIAQEIASTWN